VRRIAAGLLLPILLSSLQASSPQRSSHVQLQPAAARTFFASASAFLLAFLSLPAAAAAAAFSAAAAAFAAALAFLASFSASLAACSHGACSAESY
jgi:hypothetical protein